MTTQDTQTTEPADPATSAPTRRRRTIIAIAVSVLLAAGIATSIYVATQPSQAEREAAYITELRDFTWSIDDGIPRAEALHWGYEACAALDNYTPDPAAPYLGGIDVSPDLPTDGDKIVPHAAGSHLCPEHADAVKDLLDGVGLGI